MKKKYGCIFLLILTIPLWSDFKDIRGNTYQKLRDSFNNEYKRAQENLSRANELVKKYPKDNRPVENARKWKSYIIKLEATVFNCPEHENVCRNCISRQESCKACAGKGYWGFWGWGCKLCNQSGKLYRPGKTYCPKCKGRWDNGINCRNCNNTGLVDCNSHNILCKKCQTVDGNIIGKNLK